MVFVVHDYISDCPRIRTTFPEKRSETKEKLYKMMREHQAKGTCSHTFGALDTVQVRVFFPGPLGSLG